MPPAGTTGTEHRRQLLRSLSRCLSVLPLSATGLLLLPGCSSLAIDPRAPAWIQGRLLVRVSESPQGPAQSASAAFELRGDSRSGELRLNSPLGTRMATAIWTPQMARLITADAERQFSDLDELSRQALGESLPLAALPNWLAGRPWPLAAHEPLAQGFGQLGWVVDTSGLAQGRVEAQRPQSPTAAAALLRVRLDLPG